MEEARMYYLFQTTRLLKAFVAKHPFVVIFALHAFYFLTPILYRERKNSTSQCLFNFQRKLL